MSLQIWLPLKNGELINKGLYKITPGMVGTLSSGNGKIANTTYYWNADGQAISLPNFMDTFSLYTNYSICAWVYFTGGATNHSSTICSSGDWNNKMKQLVFALNTYNNGYTKLLVPNKDGWDKGVTIPTLAPNTWNHICVTYDGTNSYVYINNSYIGAYTGGGITSEFDNSNLYIGCATYYNGFTIKGSINDFRIYDHCLSKKEISEISKGLVLHYPLRDTYVNTISTISDSSGLGNVGTIIGTLTTSTDSKRNAVSTVFSGAQAIQCGRGAMIKDAITISWWGYMDNWSNYGRAISCTEGGGWNFEPGDGKMRFRLGTGTSSNTYILALGNTALSSLSSGWHMFTGTYDGYSLKIYVDGVLENTTSAYTTKTPIYYHASNSVFIGAEAGASATTPADPYFSGRLSDIRIYATALSAEDIKALYNTPIKLDNKNNLFAMNFKEG